MSRRVLLLSALLFSTCWPLGDVSAQPAAPPPPAQQPAPPEPDALQVPDVPSEVDAPKACFPSCRSGYLCHQGQCISQCNPPCSAGERCRAGECYLRAAPAAGPPVPTPAMPSAAARPEPEPEPEPRTVGPMDDPMGSVGVTLKLGMAGQGKEHLQIDDGPADDLDANVGLLASIALNILDGHGFGMDLNLSVRRYAGSQDGYDYQYGTFTLEPLMGVRLQLMRAMYLFAGAGPRIGMEWQSDADNRGLVTGFRVPVQLIYYVTPQIALSAELAAGFQAMYWTYNTPYDSVYGATARSALYDFSMGVRFF